MIITGKKFSKPAMSRVINGDTELKKPLEKIPRKRLDLILVELYKEYNRSTLQNFIKSGYVSIDKKILKKPNLELEWPINHLGKKPVITLHVPKQTPPPDLAQFLLYQDDNVLVLNKPAGLLSMAKGEYSSEPTLENYGYLVHRLDRDTSGVVILAKNPATQSFLRRQFQDRKVKKTYLAIVDGTPKLDQALIDLPIARNLKHPTTFMVDPNGKTAKTYYRVLKTISDKKQSLILLQPVSGRTHQLRVHLKYLGTPILEDPIYNNRQEKTSHGLFLHAYSLEITLPGGKRQTFFAPPPEKFFKIIPSLKQLLQTIKESGDVF